MNLGKREMGYKGKRLKKTFLGELLKTLDFQKIEKCINFSKKNLILTQENILNQWMFHKPYFPFVYNRSLFSNSALLCKNTIFRTFTLICWWWKMHAITESFAEMCWHEDPIKAGLILSPKWIIWPKKTVTFRSIVVVVWLRRRKLFCVQSLDYGPWKCI